MAKHKGAFSWAMYDWANSAFSTVVQAGFFPIFFKNFWSHGVEVTESTWRLGIAVSTGSLIVAMMAPIIGAFADRGAAKKRFLFAFATLGILATGSLYFVPEGNWKFAVIFYVLGTVGFLGSFVFYDSLLVSVSDESTVDVVSGRGYALGYLGGGLLFCSTSLWCKSRRCLACRARRKRCRFLFFPWPYGGPCSPCLCF
jgi:UMF1 family MFS transporter